MFTGFKFFDEYLAFGIITGESLLSCLSNTYFCIESKAAKRVKEKLISLIQFVELARYLAMVMNCSATAVSRSGTTHLRRDSHDSV